jgi:hypothetical protein
MLVLLPRHLLRRWQHRLDLAEVDHHRARVAALLDDPGDDVALLAGELAVPDLVLGVAQPLQDDLLGRGGRDPAEVGRGVVVLADQRAVLGELPRVHGDVPGLAVQLGASVLLGALGPVVGHQQRLLDRLDDDVQGDVLLPLQRPQHGHVDIHVSSPPPCRRQVFLFRRRRQPG